MDLCIPWRTRVSRAPLTGWREAQVEQIQPNKSTGQQLWSIFANYDSLENLKNPVNFGARHMDDDFSLEKRGVPRAPLTLCPSMSSLGLGNMWPPMVAACCHVLLECHVLEEGLPGWGIMQDRFRTGRTHLSTYSLRIIGIGDIKGEPLGGVQNPFLFFGEGGVESLQRSWTNKNC